MFDFAPLNAEELGSHILRFKEETCILEKSLSQGIISDSHEVYLQFGTQLFQHLQHQTATEFWAKDCLRLVTESALVGFKYFSSPGDRICLQFKQQTYITQGQTRFQHGYGYEDWLAYLQNAIVLRDPKLIREFSLLDPRFFCQWESNLADPFLLGLIDLYKAAFSSRQNLGSVLQRPELNFDLNIYSDDNDLDRAYFLLYPQVKILRSLVQRSLSSYQQAMTEALKRHRVYYEGKSSNDHPVSIPLTALSTLALDGWGYPPPLDTAIWTQNVEDNTIPPLAVPSKTMNIGYSRFPDTQSSEAVLSVFQRMSFEEQLCTAEGFLDSVLYLNDPFYEVLKEYPWTTHTYALITQARINSNPHSLMAFFKLHSLELTKEFQAIQETVASNENKPPRQLDMDLDIHHWDQAKIETFKKELEDPLYFMTTAFNYRNAILVNKLPTSSTPSLNFCLSSLGPDMAQDIRDRLNIGLHQKLPMKVSLRQTVNTKRPRLQGINAIHFGNGALRWTPRQEEGVHSRELEAQKFIQQIVESSPEFDFEPFAVGLLALPESHISPAKGFPLTPATQKYLLLIDKLAKEHPIDALKLITILYCNQQTSILGAYPEALFEEFQTRFTNWFCHLESPRKSRIEWGLYCRSNWPNKYMSNVTWDIIIPSMINLFVEEASADPVYILSKFDELTASQRDPSHIFNQFKEDPKDFLRFARAIKNQRPNLLLNSLARCLQESRRGYGNFQMEEDEIKEFGSELFQLLSSDLEISNLQGLYRHLILYAYPDQPWYDTALEQLWQLESAKAEIDRGTPENCFYIALNTKDTELRSAAQTRFSLWVCSMRQLPHNRKHIVDVTSNLIDLINGACHGKYAQHGINHFPFQPKVRLWRVR
nr:Imm49 family immunity protein [Hahella ganghwensis]